MNEGSPQEKWDKIVTNCLNVGKEFLGTKHPKIKTLNDKILEDLSLKQKVIRNDINATKAKPKRKELIKERRSVLKDIRKRVTCLEDEKLVKELEEIEKVKDDSNRCHQAIRNIKNRKPKKPLLVEKEDGTYAGNEKEQIESITKHFASIFSTYHFEENINYPPSALQTPFTRNEIANAAKSLKNNKSAGIDNLNAEYIKYAPPDVHIAIADLLNETAETGQIIQSK